ncbi:GtrA family protein [Salinarimonas soli]|uniref:GtrA family protein n=1 Tax=Salinarimonas soli TaxID=1638099 RepID=A0A5B2V7M5_9HYPH|nr:GtrA family protein [Salinarimonas soli]KAA2234971.1 GtrA family protein [Salinarimonas soli]
MPASPTAASLSLTIRYVLFAAISTVANLATQELVVRLAPAGVALVAAILSGTVAGFAVKYVLDKRWIFNDGYRGPRDEARKISLYGLFSVVTTLIFWGFEVAFWTLWGTTAAKYTGAVLGLAIGYAVKFILDRTYTFKERVA